MEADIKHEFQNQILNFGIYHYFGTEKEHDLRGYWMTVCPMILKAENNVYIQAAISTEDWQEKKCATSFML